MSITKHLEQFIRNDLCIRMGVPTKGAVREALGRYAVWQSRVPAAVARSVYESDELLANPIRSRHIVKVQKIVSLIASGRSVAPYLSSASALIWPDSSVTEAVTRKLARRSPGAPGTPAMRRDIDTMLSAWGIHHLHLGTAMRPDGFIERTDDLLFVAFRGLQAYLINIYTHGHWYDREVLATAVRAWPNGEVVAAAQGVLGLSGPTPTDAEHELLLKSGVTTSYEIDGRVYMPLGQTTAGTPAMATMWANKQMHQIWWLQRELDHRSQHLTELVRLRDVLNLARPLREALPAREGGSYGLSLRTDEGGGYWPIIEDTYVV